jgi:hypothetical protein
MFRVAGPHESSSRAGKYLSSTVPKGYDDPNVVRIRRNVATQGTLIL